MFSPPVQATRSTYDVRQKLGQAWREDDGADLDGDDPTQDKVPAAAAVRADPKSRLAIFYFFSARPAKPFQFRNKTF